MEKGKTRTALPKRDYMDGPITWRTVKPDFTVADEQFMSTKSCNHQEGSLEMIVENLVKTWEMEASHKIVPKEWQTVDPEKFQISTNKGKKHNLKELIKNGNYNCMMQNQPLYNAKVHDFESSHRAFRGAFTKGFPWELLEIFSGPPVIVFSWRHWAIWSGEYNGNPPTGETLEMFGMCVARVSKDLKIEELEVFFDPNQILVPLTDFKHNGINGKCPFSK